MTARYAADTSVSSDRSRAEIERTIQRFNASSFAYGWQENRAVVQFVAEGRQVRFVLELPDRRERRFTHTEGRGLARTPQQAEAAWEQACRASWRSLALLVKAKLAAVEANITTFESEFMAHVVLPSGQTVREWLGPQIADAYEHGLMPDNLPQLGSGR